MRPATPQLLEAPVEPEERCRASRAVPRRYYITTAINYANGLPHMGHAYEGVCADVIARYHRAYGREALPRHFPQTLPRHFRDTSHRHFRDTSEALPRHFLGTSQALPRHFLDSS